LGGAPNVNAPNENSFLTAVRNFAPISVCPTGGISVDAGVDNNGNGVLDTAEVTSTQFVCNGTAGTNGFNALVSITTEPPSANCTTGGKKVSVGSDTNVNSILDNAEIISSSYICNGVDGASGSNGANGTNGLNTLVATATLLPGDVNCAYGGNKITSGPDANVNGILDSGEVNSTSYVCNGVDGANGTNGANGANGANGLNTLMATATLLPGDVNCAYGGSKVTSGLDANADSVLDSGEVSSTTYVCNGATGATGATGGGLSEYAYIYNLAAQSVAVEAPVLFDSNGVLSAGITHTISTSEITVVNAGIYEIAFSLSATESNQFALFVNGVVVPGSVYGSGAVSQQTNGQVILALVAGDIVTLVNHSSAGASVTLSTPIGGTATNVNASIVIQKLD
jgi:hypothetical protein